MTPTYSGEQATEIVRHARTGLPQLIADDIVGKTLRLFPVENRLSFLCRTCNLIPPALRRARREGSRRVAEAG